MVLVRGDPGIGKSALVRAALADLSVPVLYAAAGPLRRRLPLRLLTDAFSPLLEGVPAAPDAPDALGQDWRFRTGDALRSLLDTLEPTIVVLEDLQWADADSLELLALLSHKFSSVPLLVVCTSRLSPERDDLAALVAAGTRHGLLSQMTLRPLDPDESLTLAGHWLGRPLGPRLQDAVMTAEGNPLYIRELLTSLDQAGGLVEGPDATMELTGSPPRTSLRETVLSHLGYLSRQTRAALEVASHRSQHPRDRPRPRRGPTGRCDQRS